MGTERRCASVHRASTAFGILLTLAASLHVCNGDSNALRDTLREKAGVELAESGQSLETSFPSNYRRQLTRADFEEIKIKKGLYDGETLNSDDFKIVFRVGDGIGDEIRCLIVRSPEEVVANIVPCTSPLKLKGRLAADGQYGVGIYGTALSTGETIEVNSIWHLDRVPPNTLLTADPKDAGETNIEFRFMGFDQTETEEHSQITYQCSLDNERWATCTSPKTVSVTDPGLHNFRVRAVDLAGNHDPYPDVYEWRIAGNPSPSPSPILASPSASPSPSVVPSPSPSVIPSPSPSVVPSPSPSVVPSPSPSVVPSPSPSPRASPVPINAAERDSSGTESSETVTTLSDEESSSGTVDSSLNGNVAIDRGSSDSDRRVTNEIIAAVVVIPCIVIIIGGAFILKKQVEVHQQLEEEAMAKAGVIKAKEASFHEPTYKDEETPRSYSERSYSERSLSEKSMSE